MAAPTAVLLQDMLLYCSLQFDDNIYGLIISMCVQRDNTKIKKAESMRVSPAVRKHSSIAKSGRMEGTWIGIEQWLACEPLFSASIFFNYVSYD